MARSKTTESSLDLSIVLPALREGKRIGKSLDRLARFIKIDPTLKKLNIETIVVAANGGDNTSKIAATKRSKFKNFRLLKPGKVVGKGRDVQYGMLRAKGKAVIFMDADLATPLKHLPGFYKLYLSGADAVIGTRNLRKHHPGYLRRLISNVGNLLFRIVGGVWIEDSQCGFKLFSAEATKLCFSKLTIMRWGFDMELLTIAKVNKLKVKTRRINDWISVPGGVFNVGIFKNAIITLKELAQILVHRLSGDYLDKTWIKNHPQPPKISVPHKVISFGVLPLLIYLLVYYLFQPHYFGQFFHAFYLDGGDGLQNVWNIWWVNKAIVHLNVSPYFTTMVHWPHGTSLLAQTMNLYNGLVGIVLMNLFKFNLVAATNFAVLSGFVGGGLTMFWFIWKLYKNYIVALIAGGLFTFSAYHFAHGLGHLQLISFQFIPLFLLAFWSMLERPRYRTAVAAAVVLFLVLLCDYYYLLWCVGLGALWFGWSLYKRKVNLDKQTIKVLLTFGILSALLVAPLIVSLTLLNKNDPLQGSHDPMAFSLDPLSVIIPGGSWRFNWLTTWHWTKLPYLSEMSIYFGFASLTVLMIAFYQTVINRRKNKFPDWLNFWWLVLLVFGILALGPRLTTFGHRLDRLPLPYAALNRIFPTLKISGMPVRWILISLIATIVIVSFMLTKLDLSTRKGRLLLLLFLAISTIELLPAALPLTPPTTRAYVDRLRTLPYGAVIDNGALSSSEQLYNQTVHDKPMAFGYVSREPLSVSNKSFLIFADLEQGRLDNICKVHRIRYITTPASRPLKTQFPVIYDDNETLIYDFKNSNNC